MRFKPNEAHVSNAVRKLNAAVFGLGGFPGGQPQPEQRRALESAIQTQPQRKTRLAGGHGPIFRVEIVRCSSRLLDSDNYGSGCKGIRDAIAQSLGLDDADTEIEWEYAQIRTRGRHGTLVKLEILK